MYYKKSKQQSGFSIFEATIIVLIILLISGIVMIALEDSRKNSRNVARAAQIKEYQKAFNVHYSDTGYYPKFGNSVSGSMCLGDYDDKACWQNGNSVLENSMANNVISPKYMSRIPPGENILFARKTGSDYEGIVYTFQNNAKTYSILYFMEGNDKSCVLDGASGKNLGEDTFCTLVMTP